MVTLPINAIFLLKIQLIWHNVTTFNYFLEAEVIFIGYIVFAVGTLWQRDEIRKQELVENEKKALKHTYQLRGMSSTKCRLFLRVHKKYTPL